MSDTSIPQRTCTKCKQSFPATLEHFHYQKNGKYNLCSWCITCHRERNKKNTAKLRENPEYKEAQRLYDEQRYQDKRDYYIEHNHKYYTENHEKELERTRLKYIKYKNRYKMRRLDSDRSERGRARIKKDKLLYRERHPARYKAQRKTNKARRRTMERNAEGHFSTKDIFQMYEDQGGHCAYCGIGIFWNIDRDVHVEHMTPLSRGGTNYPDNICLSCEDCNMSKRNLTVSEWIATRGW